MTNHRWTRKRSHRSMAMLVTALTLVVGACGSDDDDDASSTTDSAELTSPGTTEPPDTTTRSDTTEPTHVSVAATAAPTREATPAAAAETSAPPTTASGDVEAAADGVVTPIVVCVDVNRGVAYFGYTNSGSATVEIPVGAANRVTLPDDTDVTAHATRCVRARRTGRRVLGRVLRPRQPADVDALEWRRYRTVRER